MEEAFRRAIRKMTGASVRLAVRPNRSAIVATLSQSMMVTWSIALFEHLDAMLNNPDANVGSSELISYSESAWKLCESGFPQIFKDCEKLYSEFRAKWIQRFSTDEVLRLLLEGGDFLVHDEEKGWALTVKNNKQDINHQQFLFGDDSLACERCRTVVCAYAWSRDAVARKALQVLAF